MPEENQESAGSLAIYDQKDRALSKAMETPIAPVDLQAGITGLDSRIATSEVEDLLQLIEARERLVQQNEQAYDRWHLRRLQRRALSAKILLSALAMAAGTALVAMNFHTAGFLTLGAGIYWLAPDLARSVFGRVTRTGQE